MSADTFEDPLSGTPAEGGDGLESSDTVVDDTRQDTPATESRRADGQQRLVFVVLPAIALALGALAGYLNWQSSFHRAATLAATESVAAAREAATAMLSYNADTVEKDLTAARERLTGSFLAEYTKLVNEVVIPGSREKKISAVAEVPAAASVSATPDQAVALIFVNQAVSVGDDMPTNTASSVKVTLARVGGQWLVSGFEPV